MPMVKMYEAWETAPKAQALFAKLAKDHPNKDLLDIKNHVLLFSLAHILSVIAMPPPPPPPPKDDTPEWMN